MPKRTDITSILIIDAGSIGIGQASPGIHDSEILQRAAFCPVTRMTGDNARAA